jgi:hypothetical protein
MGEECVGVGGPLYTTRMTIFQDLASDNKNRKGCEIISCRHWVN